MYARYRKDLAAMKQTEFGELLKQLLSKETDEPDPILSNNDVDELLHESSETNDDSPRCSLFGYPTRPLYREISNILWIWMQTRCCPVLDLPTYNLLDEKTYSEHRASTISSITPLLEGLSSLSSVWSLDEKMYRLREIIKLLGKRGLLDLLGVRKTVGTYDQWPPARRTLENTFKERHKPESPSLLTVGARALSKHAHRDETSSWWGVCTGTEAAKNEHANETLKNILDDATWVNIHGLPQDTIVVEARQENGYGIRWTADGKQFRGFLEPQMVDGHAVGWKH